MKGDYIIPKFLNISQGTLDFMFSCMQMNKENRPFWKDLAKLKYLKEAPNRNIDPSNLTQEEYVRTYRQNYSQKNGCNYWYLLDCLSDDEKIKRSTKTVHPWKG